MAARCWVRRSRRASPGRARCPRASTSAATAATPDWTGPEDLEIKIRKLREITDWEKPIYVKIAASRPYYDVKIAAKTGADVIVLDGMQGGTAATQEVFIELVGIPILAAIAQAVQALQEEGLVSGGIRHGADVAKCLALGADAVAIGTAALIALGDNAPGCDADYRALGSAFTLEGAAMARVPLAGTSWIPGQVLRPPCRRRPRSSSSGRH